MVKAMQKPELEIIGWFGVTESQAVKPATPEALRCCMTNMSDKIGTQTPTEIRQAWLRRLCRQFLKLQTKFPVKDFLHEKGVPAWVENVEREVGAALCPTAAIKDGLELTPRGMGALLGHSCAFGVWMMEAFQYEMHRLEHKIDLSKYAPEQIEQGQKLFAGFVDDWYPALCRLAKRALSSAVDQSYEDMTEFLLAYSQAFARKPARLGMPDIGNSAFRIYFFLLNYWREVSLFKSVHQLHAVLVKNYGSHQVGELKRIEKICQRIGLSYRKPGRPRKLELIPTPA